MSRQFDLITSESGTARTNLERWAAIPLRLIVGFGFIAHGYAKLARGPMHFIDTLHALGVPAPGLTGWATIIVELVGGFAVLIGAFIPLISIPLAAILLVAAFTVHLPYGFSSIKLQSVTSAGPQFGKPGYETDLLYLTALATLVLGGPGPLAVASLLDGRWRDVNQGATPSRNRNSIAVHPHGQSRSADV